MRVGDPTADDTTIGPVVSAVQFEKIQALIEKGIEEGAKLECGDIGRPHGLNAGYYVRPTVFSHVNNDMTIAREEIFGPVLSLIGYEDDDDAVRIANDTSYGLSDYVSGATDRARDVARRIRTGNVHLNGTPVDNQAPFGGYKQSGNGLSRLPHCCLSRRVRGKTPRSRDERPKSPRLSPRMWIKTLPSMWPGFATRLNIEDHGVPEDNAQAYAWLALAAALSHPSAGQGKELVAELNEPRGDCRGAGSRTGILAKLPWSGGNERSHVNCRIRWEASAVRDYKQSGLRTSSIRPHAVGVVKGLFRFNTVVFPVEFFAIGDATFLCRPV